ncbi:MAG: hypothetical protein JXQ93_06690 [Flavobacteriaceae bacterium]
MTLKIISKDSIENSLLERIEFNSLHENLSSLQSEITKIGNLLKNRGFFLYKQTLIKESDNTFISLYELGFRISFVHIYIPKKINHPKGGDTIKLMTSEVINYLEDLTLKKDIKGESFTEISLKDFSLKNDILQAVLNVKKKDVRKINRVVTKGYESLSKKIIKYDFDINIGDVFNKKKLEHVSKLSKQLPFIEELKPPEVLFTKDSTIVYLYLKRKRNNSFDGIVSFASDENDKGLLFNGIADLKLNNLLNGGEDLSIFWNSIGNEKQEFSLKIKIPYVFSSRITPLLSFNLYRQDSVFLNTEFNSKLLYKINTKSDISFNYSSQASNNLKEDITNNNINSFDKNLLGIGYQYKDISANTINQEGFFLTIEALYGTRKNDFLNDKQIALNLEFSNTFILNDRTQIYGRNKTGILFTNNLLENEKYRIGGANSIRGFNEQSVFTSQFSYVNLEYRYLTSKSSYLYSITDIGIVQVSDNSNESILGVGFGYLFNIKNAQVNLGYVLGKSSTNNFNLNNSKLIVNFKSYF